MKSSLKSQVPSLKSQASCTQRAYLLTEALVYLGVVAVILSVGCVAMYRCIDNCIVLRRNANDIVRAVTAGERWRADVRAAGLRARLDGAAGGQILHLQSTAGVVDYRFADGAVCRRAGAGEWVSVLDRVRSSAFEKYPRQSVSAWRWELELEPRLKGAMRPGRVRPLFTFLAVPRAQSTP